MRKRVLLSSIIVGAVVLALVGTSVALAKAHVPLGRAQICTPNGITKTVSTRAMAKRLDQGACRLTACAFNDVDNGTLVKQFIYLAGDPCDPTDADGDDFCDATGAPRDVPGRLSAVNVTTACTDSF